MAGLNGLNANTEPVYITVVLHTTITVNIISNSDDRGWQNDINIHTRALDQLICDRWARACNSTGQGERARAVIMLLRMSVYYSNCSHNNGINS